MSYAIAEAAPPSSTAVSPAAAGVDMPSAVEEFAYPGAAKILKDRKITLKQGDGHILLTDCKSAHDLMVESRSGDNFFCFTISGKQGYLTMELPQTHGIWTKGHPVQAKLTAGGQTTVVNAPVEDFTPVGEMATGKQAVLLELRVTG
ncbi:hypothetical protein [Streptomyces sp. cg36]|uniref:hypothetical protein n=1 Tax=Streptomyces sp. cg36 TaxID=3238798 RepID=UPI0034E2EA72